MQPDTQVTADRTAGPPPKGWVGRFAESHYHEMEDDVRALTAIFQDDYTEDRTDVPPAEYLQMRRETWDDPKARQLWLDQVGPEQFLDEYFQAFGVPAKAQQVFMEATRAGIPFAQAVLYANTIGYPVPIQPLQPPMQSPPLAVPPQIAVPPEQMNLPPQIAVPPEQMAMEQGMGPGQLMEAPSYPVAPPPGATGTLGG